jgi:hypothetical protein
MLKCIFYCKSCPSIVSKNYNSLETSDPRCDFLYYYSLPKLVSVAALIIWNEKNTEILLFYVSNLITCFSVIHVYVYMDRCSVYTENVLKYLYWTYMYVGIHRIKYKLIMIIKWRWRVQRSCNKNSRLRVTWNRL